MKQNADTTLHPRTLDASPRRGFSTTRSQKIVKSFHEWAHRSFADFPWSFEVRDWEGNHFTLGGDRSHWRKIPLVMHFHTPAPAIEIMNMDGLGFLERFLAGEVDLEGNVYLLDHIHRYLRLRAKIFPAILGIIKNRAFQNTRRAKVNVKNHYDIPQEALNIYLDQVYQSYSCGIFSDPQNKDLDDLLRVGQGKNDTFDSLEKAQWRKFKDAVDYVAPREGETLLDVGCGYGGQLVVALENHPFGKVVGWTHSSNQVREGMRLLKPFSREQYELREGDYREDERVYDHVTSTGMISHVGPRGLVPYVREVRKRIKRGGRYIHHALMRSYRKAPLDFLVGPTFNKKYVWPGFHWFTVGEHVRALEKNGFQISKMINLSPSYEKTTAAWYERMMANRETMVKYLGTPTLRAWQIYLAGVSGAMSNLAVHVYRIYCVAT